MKISDIKVIGEPLVRAQAREVDELEGKLWITFPDGYREYVTQLGEGVLGGTFVRVYPPWRIEKALTDWRDLVSDYWSWDKGKERLPKARALECVAIGDTMQGDVLVFHPRHPDRLFVLPRDEDDVFIAGADLLSALDWMCGSGKLTRRFKEREFEPFDSRGEKPTRKEVSDPPGKSLKDIVTLGRDWARRHDARKTLFDGLPVGKGKASFIYEAIVLNSAGGGGLDEEEPGYLAVFRVDKPTGEVRIYNYQMTEYSTGGVDGDIAKRDPPDE